MQFRRVRVVPPTVRIDQPTGQEGMNARADTMQNARDKCVPVDLSAGQSDDSRVRRKGKEQSALSQVTPKDCVPTVPSDHDMLEYPEPAVCRDASLASASRPRASDEAAVPLDHFPSIDSSSLSVSGPPDAISTRPAFVAETDFAMSLFTADQSHSDPMVGCNGISDSGKGATSTLQEQSPPALSEDPDAASGSGLQDETSLDTANWTFEQLLQALSPAQLVIPDVHPQHYLSDPI